MLNFMLSGTHDMFRHSRILWLAQEKVPYVFLAYAF
jgi:hypothetical protein